MACKHKRVSGQLRLREPCRMLIAGVLVCDRCGEVQKKLPQQGAEATALALIGMWAKIQLVKR